MEWQNCQKVKRWNSQKAQKGRKNPWRKLPRADPVCPNHTKPRQGLTAAPGLFHALPPLWEAVPAAAVLGWPARCAPCAPRWAAFPLWVVFLYPCALWRLLWAFLAVWRAYGHKRTPAGCEPVRGCGCYLHFRRGFWRFQYSSIVLTLAGSCIGILYRVKPSGVM